MTVYAAFLRAVNVGGTGKLPMEDLLALCQKAGFESARTFLATGNVIFKSKLSEEKVATKLEQLLQDEVGLKTTVYVRSLDNLKALMKDNPLHACQPDKTVVCILADSIPADSLKQVSGRDTEQIELGHMVAYVHFPDGIGRSKLKAPFLKTGTSRNLNTLNKMIALAEKLDDDSK